MSQLTQAQVNNAVNAVVNEYSGRLMSYYGGALGQCGVVGKLYVDKLVGVRRSPGMANDRADGWGTNFPAQLAPFFAHEVFQRNKKYPAGTLVLYAYPHLVLVVSHDGGKTAKVFEQNSPVGSPCHLSTKELWNDKRVPTYALVPRVVVQMASKPSPVPPAKPVAINKPRNVKFSRLSNPLYLIVNKQPTKMWALDFTDYAHARATEHLPKGHAFTAVGKAQRTDLDRPCYYMSKTDFGNADVTGVPNKNQGINTVDLSPQPTPPQPKPIVASIKSEATEQTTNNVALADMWKQSYTSGLGEVQYVAAANATIHDLSGVLPDAQLIKGKLVPIAGTFQKDGVLYCRTTKSVNSNAWYGIPPLFLTRLKPLTDEEIDQEIDIFAQDTEDESKIRNAAITATATTVGFWHRILHKLFGKK